MKLCIGPVERTSAHAWIVWTKENLHRMRTEPASAAPLPTPVIDEVDAHLDVLDHATRSGGEIVHYQVEVDPDHLEYLTYSLYTVDLHLAEQALTCPAAAEPPEGRTFHVVLVRDLLVTLAQASPTQAAFAAQLRPSWPLAGEAD